MPHAPALPSVLTVVHPIALLEQPAFGAAPLALLAPGDMLAVVDVGNGFGDVRTAAGRGFVALAACAPYALGAAGAVESRQVGQPVTLYGWPVPGWQFAGAPIVDPAEPLLVLGRDGAFALVQRDTGQLGFVPAALVGVGGPSDPHALVGAGPVDLGWITVGAVLFVANWLTLRALLMYWLPSVVPPYVMVGGLLLGVCAYLVLLSPRRVAARSLALGALVGVALLHLFSGGALTM